MTDYRGLTYAQKQEILERDCYICAYCDGIATDVDHVVPYSYSKCNDEYNLVASCHECNLIASSFVFKSFTDKRMYIRKTRQGKKWRAKLAAKISVCTECHKQYIPGHVKATNFLCPSCASEEYSDCAAPGPSCGDLGVL